MVLTLRHTFNIAILFLAGAGVAWAGNTQAHSVPTKPNKKKPLGALVVSQEKRQLIRDALYMKKGLKRCFRLS